MEKNNLVLKYRVEQRHIDKGVCGSSTRCPQALAIKDALEDFEVFDENGKKRKFKVYLCQDYVDLISANNLFVVFARGAFTKKIKEFIRRFDGSDNWFDPICIPGGANKVKPGNYQVNLKWGKALAESY